MGMTRSVRESGSKCFWKRATKASTNCLARGLLGCDSCTLPRNCSIPASISCRPRFFAPVTSINSRMRAAFCGSIAPEAGEVFLAADWDEGLGAAFSWAFTRSDGEWARITSAPERRAHPMNNARIYSLLVSLAERQIESKKRSYSHSELAAGPRECDAIEAARVASALAVGPARFSRARGAAWRSARVRPCRDTACGGLSLRPWRGACCRRGWQTAFHR